MSAPTVKLRRNDSCKHFVDTSGNFVKCYTSYSAVAQDPQGNTYTTVFTIPVTPTMLPGGQQQTPTDAQIQSVADPIATAKYNDWVARLQGDKVVLSGHPGQSQNLM